MSGEVAVAYSLERVFTPEGQQGILRPSSRSYFHPELVQINPAIEKHLHRAGARLVDPDKTILGNLPEVFGIRKPADFNPLYRFGPASEEFINSERAAILKDPARLVYLCAIRPSLLDLFYPKIFEGHYIPPYGISKTSPSFAEKPSPSPQTSPETSRLLTYFGCENAQELFTATAVLVRKKFKASSLAGENVVQALEFMQKLHQDKKRKSGEPAITHELRILLRVMGGMQLLGYDKAPSVYSHSFYTQLLSALYCGIVLHDFKEDYSKNGRAGMVRKGNDLLLISENQDTAVLHFSDGYFTELVEDMLTAFTNYDFDPEKRSEVEAAMENTYKIIMRYQKYPVHIAWGIVFGKCCDREDNLEHLELYEAGRYLRKLKESYLSYQFSSILGWVADRAEIPMAVSTAVMKLLGAGNDELFGWIAENPEFIKFIREIREQGFYPLVIPSIHRTCVFINDPKGTFAVIKPEDAGGG